MILTQYPEAYVAYSLRKLNSNNDFQPLIRVARAYESYTVECDVYPDENQEISFDSYIYVSPTQSNASNLGEFLAATNYTDVDDLRSFSNAKILALYDQANDNNYLISTTSEGFDLTVNSQIYKINNKPAFKANLITNPTSVIPVIDDDTTIHFLVSPTDSTSRLGFADASGYTATYFAAVVDDKIFEVGAGLNLTVNNIYKGEEAAEYDFSNTFEYYNFDYNTTSTEVFAFEFDRTDVQLDYIQFADSFIVADVLLYPNYDSKRRFYINSELANDYNTDSKLIINTNTQNSFITEFGTPAAAYSVRSLRGLTGLNGPKVLRVRREVDNAEVDVYTDNSGWVSLDSPVVIVPAITGQIDGGTGVEIESLASTLGEFVADADHDDVDSLGSPTTAKVVVWYDQSSVDYTIISEEIDARGAPVRIRVVGGTYDAYEFDLYFDDNESISLSSYVADTYEISDGATQVTANLTLGTLQTLVDAGMTEATVCVWYDQSGNANDATQTTTGSQPIIFTGGAVVTENGEPALDFNGSSHYLFTSNEVMTGDELCMIGLAKTTDVSTSRRFIDQSGALNGGGLITTGPTLKAEAFSRFNGVLVNPLSDETYLNQRVLMTGDFKSGNSTLHVDGVLKATDTTTFSSGGNTGVPFSIGKDIGQGGQYHQGTLQEAIVYTTSQSTTRIGIEDNINTYYDIYGTGNTGVNTPLLDTYSDAVAAYSLRKLRTSYNGPVNLSKRKDAIQNVATAQPKIYDSSTGVITDGSRASIDYTVGNVVLIAPNLFTSGNAAFIGVGSWELSGVLYLASMMDTFNDGYELSLQIFSANNVDAIIALSDPDLHVVFGNYDGSTNLFARDGVATTTSGVTTLDFSGPLNIGSRNNQPNTYNLNGHISELIIYNSSQSENRTDIENNINSAFQIYAANFSSVLDSVPLAKAAYSIRRLTKNYIDPIITVTNGSTTKDFYADFWGNLDVDALTSFANGGTLSVTKWWDQSGEGVHLLTTSTRPTLTIANNEVSVNTTNKFYEPLLDRYEGAAAAYSLRILKGDYTGPLVRVRRDGTNTEVDVYPDENLTISLNSQVLNVAETTTGVTVNPADTLANTLGEFVADAGNDPDGLGAPVSAFVVVWYDQANSNNASQDISIAQPKIYDSSTGVVTENGKPAVLFDGVDDGYLTPLASSDPSTYFITCDNNGNSGKTPASPMQVNSFYIDNRTALRVRVNGTEFTTATQTAADFQIQYILHNTTASEAAVNGAAVTSGTVGAANGTVVSIGQAPLGGKWLGNIYELVIYQSDQSANRTGIETNVNNHYQIPNFNATASTAQTVAVYNNAINTTVDLNATYTDLKEIIKYE